MLYSLLAGFFLGIYLITWQGGLLFVFIIGLYFILQFIIDHLKGKSTEYLGITGFVVFLLAMIIGTFGALMIWNYRPLRYQTILIYPVCAAAGIFIQTLLDGRKTEVNRVYHLDRGYEAIEKKFAGLGAAVNRVKA